MTLMAHPDPRDRVHAAEAVLPLDPQATVPILEEIDGQNRMSISTAAMFALEFWKRGYPPPEKRRRNS